MNKYFFLLLAFVLIPIGNIQAQTELRMANLDTCQLESGEVIENCKLGYCTYGELNADSTNAILFPAWFTGTSANLREFIGPNNFVDDSEWFVITVDPFGNGISSSPSTSENQPAGAFPEYTIRDMVAAQHRLVTEVLGLNELHGVIGISMGGIQVFEWIVSYPKFIDKSVSISGTPRMNGYDLIRWQTELEIIEAAATCDCLDPDRFTTLWQTLVNFTPAYFNEHLTRKGLAELLDGAKEWNFNAYDRASQIRAMLAHDATAAFGGSLERAADATNADLLVIAAEEDYSVNPRAAVAFANYAEGSVLRLPSPCGHYVFSCEAERIGQAVRKFFRKTKL